MSNNEILTRQIASVLKEQRQKRGWSLDKTAAATGVSKAMLGQIERQESSPTIATLWKIATGLECSFSSFITSQDANAQHSHVVFSQENGVKCDANMQVKPFSLIPLTLISKLSKLPCWTIMNSCRLPTNVE